MASSKVLKPPDDYAVSILTPNEKNSCKKVGAFETGLLTCVCLVSPRLIVEVILVPNCNGLGVHNGICQLQVEHCLATCCGYISRPRHSAIYVIVDGMRSVRDVGKVSEEGVKVGLIPELKFGLHVD